MNGVIKAWEKMVKYCAKDVTLLEKVYLKIRPYLKQHPNLGVYSDDIIAVCPTCGCKDLKYSANHYAYTQMGKFKRFRCLSCGKWGRDTQNILDKKKKATNTTNIS